METDKNRFEDLLFNYFSGTLTEEEEKVLAQWLDESDANRTFLSEMSDWWATAHMPRFAANRKKNFEQHFGYLMKQAEPMVRKRVLVRKLWSMAAASVLLLLATGT
ncbi:MAG: anti-sigma factor, partial [Tannerellaceae bacterium]